MWTLITIAVLAFVSLAVYGQHLKVKNARRIAGALSRAGIDTSEILFTAAYLCGHPKIDALQDSVSVLLSGAEFEIWRLPAGFDGFDPECLGAIPALGLINALVEDQTTVEHRVTVGRMLAVGLFAIAWRKQKKTESAYLTLEWSDGRFQHETVFAFTGAGAMQAANTARNAVLRVVGV